MDPQVKLPFGLPPTLPNIKDELKQYLLHPDKLPIHDFKRCQLFWDREPDVTSLFHFEQSPMATTLKAKRDPFTGEVTDFEEVVILDTGLTAKNSLSLNRAPVDPSQSIRGNASFYPFWPGGFPDPKINVSNENDSLSDMSEEFFIIPPGFQRGLEFLNDGFTLKTEQIEEDLKTEVHTVESLDTSEVMVNLMSVIKQDQDLLANFWSDTSKPSKLDEDNDFKNIKLEIDDSEVVAEEPAVPVLNITDTVVRTEIPQKTDWAEMINVNIPVTDFREKIPDMAMKYPFELDNFQKQAILKLEDHSNVLVAAHTSAGKTVVAEYAIALAQRHMTRTVYTSPIKALSNQKYRDFKHKFDDVGLITGDFQINQTAACLIMTTEILRSMLYCGSDVIRDLEYVIFDEVHYLNDSDRGHVWEEVLILLPNHVTIVMLSATISNPMKFAEWVGQTKQRKVYVVSTTRRPVPLLHYLYTGMGGKTCNDRFLILNEDGNFISEGYAEAKSKLKASTSSKNTVITSHKFTPINLKHECVRWVGLLSHLQKKQELPVVAFVLSRKRCDNIIAELSSVDLTNTSEKFHIERMFTQAIERLKKPDRELPQVLSLKDYLVRGMGIHHSGILPILKEIVEMLFEKEYVKLLFATETFAMGVNMPTRTVVFDSVYKYDGVNTRLLLPAEYIQMAGRAGRRGDGKRDADPSGTVIILCKYVVPPVEEFSSMMLEKPNQLTSKFRLTYRMLLNLLRVESLTVESMMVHSFREVDHTKRMVRIRNELIEIEKKFAALETESTVTSNMERFTNFYNVCIDFIVEWNRVQPKIIQKVGPKELYPGRILIISHKDHYNKIALLLNIQKSKKPLYVVLVLVDREIKNQSTEINLVLKQQPQFVTQKPETEEKSDEWYKMVSLVRQDEIFQPEGVGGHTVLRIEATDIWKISTKSLKYDTDIILRDWEQRQIPRFSDNPPGQTCAQAVQELAKLTNDICTKSVTLEFVKPKLDLNVVDFELLERLRKKISEAAQYINVANFEKQFEELFQRKHLERKQNDLKYLLSNESLSLYPEYKSRVKVLSSLRYIDEHNRVELKGRVACEISTNELIITELVFRNTLTNLQPAEVAALLSGLVFQGKTNFSETEENLPQNLKNGMKQIEDIYLEILHLENTHQVESVSENLNFGLINVVYEWAQDKPFTSIMTLTDVQEGIIVRCIQQLNEILRDVRDAARLIGDPVLQQKMQDASDAIKRDIVFAASLYTQKEIIG